MNNDRIEGVMDAIKALEEETGRILHEREEALKDIPDELVASAQRDMALGYLSAANFLREFVYRRREKK